MQQGQSIPEAKSKENYNGYGIEWLIRGAKELTLGRTTIAVGANNPLHRHPNCEEALYVLSGRINHKIAGTPDVVLATGEAIVIPRNINHQAFNIGTEPAVLLVAFSSGDRQTIIQE